MFDMIYHATHLSGLAWWAIREDLSCMKVTKQIKITKFTLGNIKKLECVENIETADGKVTVYLKKDMTNGRLEANMNQFLVQFQNGMWQVYGAEAINNLYKNPGKEAGNQWG